jgi:competence protein ComEA
MDNEYSSKSVIFVSLIVIAVIIIGMVLLISTRPRAMELVINPPDATLTPAPSPAPAPILVYITGAVVNPETTVELPAGSRVQDALDAAGGTSSDADAERVNVVGILHDGDHIHVYSVNDPIEIVTEPTPTGGEKIYVNTATVEELDSLPGIGPSIAQRIVDYREENGPFTDLASLGEVSGIGDSILEQVAELVSFE